MIDPERWRILSPYLDEALDTPTEGRGQWLAEIRRQDPWIASELEAMLAEHESVAAKDFLSGAVLDPNIGPPPSMEGEVLGAYRLVSLIGQGGSGSVWLAERCDGRFHGQAAVKLLSADLIARAGEQWFRREGTILARLRHPGIAHLIDAGVAPTGQPYLVIEHVDGIPIDRYCDGHEQTIEARLRLFVRVLDAVAHAHANLVVHRDIKPANVFVSRDGDVKLLDFGIAKLLEPAAPRQERRSRDSSTISRELGHALTPEYAAPEQVSGDDVTTATDVYALGVLLYLLLTGRHPAGDFLGSQAELLRAILLREPVRPSAAASAEQASRCRSTPARLRRRLAGDIDAIIARALKKDASERYPSVGAFADDIRRHLAHEPVAARTAGVGYRASRFVRRHWRATAAGALAGIALVGLVSVHTSRLATERDRAQREANKAGKVSEILTGVLTSADPYASRAAGGEPTVRSLLDASAVRVEAELAGEPEIQAEMLTMMGRTYRKLGEYAKAHDLLQQALAAGQRAFGSEHPEVARTLHDLGVLAYDTGDYATAAQRLEEARRMRSALLGQTHADVAVTLAELGRVYQDHGLGGRAEPVHREALAIRRQTLGEDDGETAVSLSDLASVLRLNGTLDEAERLLRRCYTINLKVRGELHPNTAVTINDLGLITMARGGYDVAAADFRRASALQRAALGASHPVVAMTLNNLARAQLSLGDAGGAAASLEEAMTIVRSAFGANHQLAGIYALNRAVVELAREQPDAAERFAREGLRIRSLAPDIVPFRRRTSLQDDWTLSAARSLLDSTIAARARRQKP